jgi:hypothetical protein
MIALAASQGRTWQAVPLLRPCSASSPHGEHNATTWGKSCFQRCYERCTTCCMCRKLPVTQQPPHTASVQDRMSARHQQHVTASPAAKRLLLPAVLQPSTQHVCRQLPVGDHASLAHCTATSGCGICSHCTCQSIVKHPACH